MPPSARSRLLTRLPTVVLGALATLIFFSPVLEAQPNPPYDCQDCANYVRYSYFASALMDWEKVAGNWRIVRQRGDNAARPVTLGVGADEPPLLLAQRFELPPEIVSAPTRYWLRFRYRRANPARRDDLGAGVLLTAGEGGLVLQDQRLDFTELTVGGWHSRTVTGTLELDPADNELTVALYARNDNILFDDVELWVEGTASAYGSCTPSPLSPLGEQARVTLEDLYELGVNSYSWYSWCNSLPGGENPFPRGWLLSNPDVRFAPSPHDSDEYYRGIADELRRTTRSFYLSSLDFDLKLVRAYLAPALGDLNDTFEGVPERYWPVVRVITSDPKLRPLYLQRLYKALVSRMGRERRVRVAAARIGFKFIDHNHTKMAIRDGRFAIVGGQNWETQYLTDPPLYDLSMRLEGDAARLAVDMFGKVWERARNNCLRRLRKPGADNPCSSSPSQDGLLPPGAYESHNVFALGRGPRWNDSLDLSADHVVAGAFRGAQRSVHISQHMMNFSGYYPTDFVLEPLFEAMIFNGIEVQILLSRPHDLRTELWPVSTQAHYLETTLYAQGRAAGLSPGELDELVCRLEVAQFRPVDDEVEVDYKTHNKFWMVDDSSFYIGSQNLYPSAIGVFNSNVNEFGFLVDDAGYAQEVHDKFWSVLWERAKDYVIPSQYAECEGREPFVIEAVPEPLVVEGDTGALAEGLVTLRNRIAFPVQYAMTSQDDWLRIEDPGPGTIEGGGEVTARLAADCPDEPLERYGSYSVDVEGFGRHVLDVVQICSDPGGGGGGGGDGDGDGDGDDNEGGGDSWGDPHLVTYDGLKYDFQTAGEFVLTRASGLEVQVRQEQWGARDVSVNTATATLVGDDRIAFYASETPPLRVDGSPTEVEEGMPLTLPGGGAVSREGSVYRVDWPTGGTYLKVRVQTDHLNVFVRPDLGLTDLRGLLGNRNGSRDDDLALDQEPPDILVSPSFAEIHGGLADSWRITDVADSLFDYAEATGPQDYNRFYPFFPPGPITLGDLDPEAVAWAQAVCTELAIADPQIYESCVLDVALTGDPDFATGAGEAARGVHEGVYFEDFESGSAAGEWSHQNVATSPSGGRRFLGQLGNDTVTLTLDALPAHSSVVVTFDLYILATWDGNSTTFGPDYWRLSVGGGPTLLETTFTNQGAHQAYPDWVGEGDWPGRTGAAEIVSLGYASQPDSVYRITRSFSHSAESLALVFEAWHLQGIGDESWGLDNVKVVLEE